LTTLTTEETVNVPPSYQTRKPTIPCS